MKKRVLLLGPHACGRTLLVSYLDDVSVDKKYKKGSVFYTNESIHVPVSYLESPWMYCHIISLQQQADLVVMIQPLGNIRNLYPPKFAKSFAKKVVGVLSYTNISNTNINMQNAKKILLQTGINEPFLQMNIEQHESMLAMKQKIQEERGR